jgi:hypothetical protein
MNIFFLLNILLVAFSLKPDKPRFCYNCKHFIKNELGDEYGKCGAFLKLYNEYTNYLITGSRDIENKDDNYYYCGVARSNPDMCGEEGSLYRMKYDKNLVKRNNDGNKEK